MYRSGGVSYAGQTYSNPSFTGQIKADDGTAAAPSYSFTNAPTVGVYQASGQLGFSTAGTVGGYFTTGQRLVLQQDLALGAVGGVDVIVKRYAAKQLSITGDGTGATTNAGIVAGYAGTPGVAVIKPTASSLMVYTSAPNTQTGATYTVVDGDNWIIANRAGTVTLTLPTASSYTGRQITVKTIQAQTVVSAASDVIPQAGGAAGTAILAGVAGNWATLVSNGTAWEIMASNTP